MCSSPGQQLCWRLLVEPPRGWSRPQPWEERGHEGSGDGMGWELPWWWSSCPAHHLSPITCHPSPVTHQPSPHRALVQPWAEQPNASHGSNSKLWPELLLSAFHLVLVACKALKRQIVTSTDLLFLLVWKHGISQQPGCSLIRDTRTSSGSSNQRRPISAAHLRDSALSQAPAC